MHVERGHVLTAGLVKEQCGRLADESGMQGAITYQFIDHTLTQVLL